MPLVSAEIRDVVDEAKSYPILFPVKKKCNKKIFRLDGSEKKKKKNIEEDDFRWKFFFLGWGGERNDEVK